MEKQKLTWVKLRPTDYRKSLYAACKFGNLNLKALAQFLHVVETLNNTSGGMNIAELKNQSKPL